jgi:hypothetical protein
MAHTHPVTVTVKVDEAGLERAIRRIERAQYAEKEIKDIGQTSLGPVLGNNFIDALIKAGVVPELTNYVRIVAEVDGVVRINYETFGDKRLSAVAQNLRPGGDPA